MSSTIKHPDQRSAYCQACGLVHPTQGTACCNTTPAEAWRQTTGLLTASLICLRRRSDRHEDEGDGSE